MTTNLMIVAFERPAIDWHAVAPEIVLLSVGVLVTLLDILFLEKARPYMAALSGLGILATAIPLLTLGIDGNDRILFDGAYVVDDFSLVLKAVFLLAGYVVVLLSTNYIVDGDYWESEYYGLLLASLMGMVMMASSRDLRASSGISSVDSSIKLSISSGIRYSVESLILFSLVMLRVL